LLEYTPPEHVESQMEWLLTLYKEMGGEYPVDNGRVARALTLDCTLAAAVTAFAQLLG